MRSALTHRRPLRSMFTVIALSVFLATTQVQAKSAAVAADEPAVEPRPTVSRYFRRFERGPLLKLSYRAFAMGRPGGQSGNFHGAAFDYYFARRFFRVAAGAEVASPLSGATDLFVLGTMAAGLQYPARITPFVEGNVGFGARHWRMLNQGLTGFAYSIGAEAGGEYAVHEHFWLSLAVGWRRPVVRQPGSGQVDVSDLYGDTFTLKFGIAI